MKIYELPDRIRNNHLKEAQCATREHNYTKSGKPMNEQNNTKEIQKLFLKKCKF